LHCQRAENQSAPTSCCSGLQREVRHAAAEAVDSNDRERQHRPRLVRMRGGRVRVGDDAGPLPQDGERPSRGAVIKPFAIDPYAVTNAWFSDFVAVTGYQTDAERYGWSLVFKAFAGGVPEMLQSQDAPSWWRRIEGARWHHPEGPHSNIAERHDHPVVHASWNDAVAFAVWPVGDCRRKRNGSAPRGEVRRMRAFPGAIRSPTTLRSSLAISGRAISPFTIPVLMAMSRQWAASCRTAPGSSTWWELRGSGAPTPSASARSPAPPTAQRCRACGRGMCVEGWLISLPPVVLLPLSHRCPHRRQRRYLDRTRWFSAHI
jgi:hypothetical protein